MIASTKELRIRPGKIIEQVSQEHEVTITYDHLRSPTITYRGKALAKIVPAQSDQKDDRESAIFGLWKEHGEENSVEDQVRTLRKGRSF